MNRESRARVDRPPDVIRELLSRAQTHSDGRERILASVLLNAKLAELSAARIMSSRRAVS
jgi:hypothetical protein